MTKTYHSPPNWPPPPAGWTPGPGWEPDPSWGPAPPGWQFWIEASDRSESPPVAIPSSAGDHELRIFLSYRRSDCQAQANGLYDGLRNRLPDARVFMDIDSIPAGVDFEEHIQREISVCDLVLVMIGDNWLDARPGSDVRRIDEPEDFVRLEIESALSSAQVRTLPVLVERAQMPRSAELPESIARLARINAIELSDMRWRADLDRLVDAVEALGLEKGKIAPSVAPPRPKPVARTSLSIGAVGNVGYDPGEAGPVTTQVPPGEPRTPAIAYLLMVVPFLSFGFAAWVPALWAGLKRPAGDVARMRLFWLSGSLLLAAALGFLLVSMAPTDAAGEATGPLLGIGSILWIFAVIGGTVVAVVFRKPPKSRP
jgi:hypothetical protein